MEFQLKLVLLLDQTSRPTFPRANKYGRARGAARGRVDGSAENRWLVHYRQLEISWLTLVSLAAGDKDPREDQLEIERSSVWSGSPSERNLLGMTLLPDSTRGHLDTRDKLLKHLRDGEG